VVMVIPKSRGNILPSSSGLKVQAEYFSETLVSTYKSTWRKMDLKETGCYGARTELICLTIGSARQSVVNTTMNFCVS
jgi:hypothetical protein